MNIVKNILAIILGIMVGGFVNGQLIKLGHTIMPVEGLDPDDFESLKAIIPTLGPKHLIFPFLAHAIGSLVAAILTGLLAVNNKMKLAIAAGSFFIIGGITMCIMIPSPVWFILLDLVVAYVPMGILGGKIALMLTKKKA